MPEEQTEQTPTPGARDLDRLRRLLIEAHGPLRERAWADTLALLVILARRSMTPGDRLSRDFEDVAASVAGDLVKQGFDPGGMDDTELRCYLAVAVRHKLVHHGRRRRAQRRVPRTKLRSGPGPRGTGDALCAVATDEPTPQAELLSQEEKELATAGLSRLDKDSQRLVRLQLAGLPSEVIGAAMGITPAAARKRWERVRRDLSVIVLREVGSTTGEIAASTGLGIEEVMRRERKLRGIVR